ncbi:hypothetical protein ACHAWF_015524 [Thalassiosira exigua]
MTKRDPPSESSSRRGGSKRRGGEGGGGDADAAAGGSGAGRGSSSAAADAPPDLTSSDPYAVLGVPLTATTREIKSSYRRLALRHHPDRLNPGEDREAATRAFAAIGNAYEILGDEGRRREYDEERRLEEEGRRWGGGGGYGGSHGGMGGRMDVFDARDPFSMFDNDPFFASFGGRRRGGGSSRSGFRFHDPFEVFEQFFAEEMGRGSGRSDSGRGRGSRSSRQRSADPFGDPFFSSFGGGGMSQMMSGHFDRMNAMMDQMHNGSMSGFDQEHREVSRNRGGGNGMPYAFSSSSASNGGGRQSVSTSTRTTVVNGVRTTVRERTVVHPDGRVERHTETLEGDGADAARLTSSSDRPAIADGGKGQRKGRWHWGK